MIFQKRSAGICLRNASFVSHRMQKGRQWQAFCMGRLRSGQADTVQGGTFHDAEGREKEG